MPTWAERLPRHEAGVTLALTAVLLADLLAVRHLHDDRRCAAGPLPSRSALAVSIELHAPVLQPGQEVAGLATVTNRSRRRVALLRAAAVAVLPGTGTPVSWRESGSFSAVELAPGSTAQVPFVVHLARCSGGAGPLAPGWYEVVLVLREGDATGVRDRRSAGRAVVVSP
ncbi:MAG TPA: hypothetical protein VMZ11_06750 [Mycobacteriales bacterium]|nr:hypothetical protein [Mycobacteriales bacterium]